MLSCVFFFFSMLYKVGVTLKSVNETLVCDHSVESYWTVLSRGTVYNAVKGAGSNVKISVDESLVCDHSTGHVRYINILTWLRGFQDKLLREFGGVFFVSKSLLETERQKKLNKVAIFTRKSRIDVRILILYRTWPIESYWAILSVCASLCVNSCWTAFTYA